MERVEAIVSGRVQMVMYRDFVQRAATALGLVGEVKNLPDGNVRVIAEGEHEILLKLIVRLHKGSLLSHVRDVSVSWKSARGRYQSFEIVYG
jgi:acylphosphatase